MELQQGSGVVGFLLRGRKEIKSGYLLRFLMLDLLVSRLHGMEDGSCFLSEHDGMIRWVLAGVLVGPLLGLSL